MQQILMILHMVFALALIVLVLVQQGKGATMGASFGAGASQTVFGSQGAGSFMLKVTGLFAALFFATSLALGHYSAQNSEAGKNNLLDSVQQISVLQNQQKTAAQQAEKQLIPVTVNK